MRAAAICNKQTKIKSKLEQIKTNLPPPRTINNATATRYKQKQNPLDLPRALTLSINRSTVISVSFLLLFLCHRAKLEHWHLILEQ